MHLFPLWKPGLPSTKHQHLKGTPSRPNPKSQLPAFLERPPPDLWTLHDVVELQRPRVVARTLGESEPTVTSGGDRWDRWAMLLLYLDEKSP